MPVSPSDSSTVTEPVIVVEAATAEEALAEVAGRLGSDADIVSVEKVLRGGIGGFFAREQVQITARPRGAAEPADGSNSDMGRLLAQLASANEADERSFAETLRTHLRPSSQADTKQTSVRPPDQPRSAARGRKQQGAEVLADLRLEEAAPRPVAPAPLPPLPALSDESPVEAVAAPAPAIEPSAEPAPAVESSPEPAPAPAAPSLDRAPEALVAAQPVLGPTIAPGMPEWSSDNLRRLGLPPLVVDPTIGLDPRDDLAWLHAIGQAVATLCRPMPTGDAVVVGPRATKFAAAWKLPVVRPGSQPPRRGSFVAPVRDTANGRSWLAWARGSRWLHLVVGGERWRDLLFDEPLAVSWTGPDSLAEAITLSANLGLVLGWCCDGPRGTPWRANPVEVAMAVRAMVPRR
jgi:hypothetical protein